MRKPDGEDGAEHKNNKITRSYHHLWSQMFVLFVWVVDQGTKTWHHPPQTHCTSSHSRQFNPNSLYSLKGVKYVLPTHCVELVLVCDTALRAPVLLCGSDSRAGCLCFKFKVAFCQVQLSVQCQLLDQWKSQSLGSKQRAAGDKHLAKQLLWCPAIRHKHAKRAAVFSHSRWTAVQSFLFSIGIKSTPQNSFIFLGHDGKKFTKAWKQKEVNAHNLYVWNNHRVYDPRNETERCLQTASLNSLKTNDRISRTDFKLYWELLKYRGPVTLGCNPSGSLVLSLRWYWQDKHKGPYSLAPSLWLL